MQNQQTNHIYLYPAESNYNKQLSPNYDREHHIDYCWLSNDFLSSILGGTIHSGKSNMEHLSKYANQIIGVADHIEKLTLSFMKDVKKDLRVQDLKADYARHSNSIKKLVESTRNVMRSLGVVEDVLEINTTAEFIFAGQYKKAAEHTKTLLIEGGIYTAISLVYDKYTDIHQSLDLLFKFTDELVKESQIESASIAYMAMFKLILLSNEIYSTLTIRFAEAVKYAMEQLDYVTLQEEQHRKILATFLFIKRMIPLGVTKIVWGRTNIAKPLQYVWCIQNKMNAWLFHQNTPGVILHKFVDPWFGSGAFRQFEIIPSHDKFYVKGVDIEVHEYLSVNYLFAEKYKPRRSVYTVTHQSAASLWSFEPSSFDEFHIKTDHNDETTYLVGGIGIDEKLYAYRGKNVTKLAEQLNPSQLTWILTECPRNLP